MNASCKPSWYEQLTCCIMLCSQSLLQVGTIIEKDVKCIERVQRRFTRLFKGLQDLPYDQRLDWLGLETLESRRQRFDLTLVFKLLNGLVDLNWKSLLSMREDRFAAPRTLFLKRCRTELRRNCFGIRVVRAWNALPEEVRCAPTLTAFKNRLAQSKL